MNCPEHGVRQVDVPWAEEGSGFTALFEALVIDWLQEASIQAVAKQLGLSWSAVDGILQRAVSRGLGRREPIATGAQLRRSNRLGGGALAATGALAVDEKAYKKRPNYLTVVSDGTHVLHVAEERREASLGDFLQSLTPAQSTAAQFRHSKRPGGGAKRTPYPVGQHGHVAALHSGHHQASAPRGP